MPNAPHDDITSGFINPSLAKFSPRLPDPHYAWLLKKEFQKTGHWLDK